MTALKESVLKIYYTDKKKRLHCKPQGKFFYYFQKPTFLADMTPNKWWRNFAGYSIAKQILDAFSKVKVRPQIIYRVKQKSILYYANATRFIKKGILVPYGSHEQYVLPVKHFVARQGDLEYEPKNLPVMSLSDWVKSASAPTARGPMSEKELFYQIYAFR